MRPKYLSLFAIFLIPIFFTPSRGVAESELLQYPIELKLTPSDKCHRGKAKRCAVRTRFRRKMSREVSLGMVYLFGSAQAEGPYSIVLAEQPDISAIEYLSPGKRGAKLSILTDAAHCYLLAVYVEERNTSAVLDIFRSPPVSLKKKQCLTRKRNTK